MSSVSLSPNLPERPCQWVCKCLAESRIGRLVASLFSRHSSPIPTPPPAPLLMPPPTPTPPPSPRYPILSLLSSDGAKHNVGGCVVRFLSPEEQTNLAQANRYWSRQVQGFNVQLLKRLVSNSDGVNIETLRQVYEGAIGPKSYKKVLGSVEPILPIPRRFIDAADELDEIVAGISDSDIGPKKRSCKAVYIPAFITISVDAHSRLILNENEKLVEADDEVGTERTIRVPVTLNHIRTLAAHRIFSDHIIYMYMFGDMDSILSQHGNTAVKAHWTYQRTSPICRGGDLDSQKTWAKIYGFEPVSLIDRFIYNVIVGLNSGTIIDFVGALTSTRDMEGSGGSIVIRFGDHTLRERRCSFAYSSRVDRDALNDGIVVVQVPENELDDEEEKKSSACSSTHPQLRQRHRPE